MSEIPKVSVLIICYNFRDFIAESIQSVLDQDYPNLEIVVTDDASTDGSQDIILSLAKKDFRIVPVLSEKNKGLSGNWNQGAERCTGEYVALLSGDDLMLPRKISRQVEYLKSNPKYSLCTHDMEVFDSKSGKRLYFFGDKFRMKPGGIELILATNWFFQKEIKSIPSSFLARTDFFLAHQFDPRLSFWNERLHLIDCLATSPKKWGHLNEVLGKYRTHEKQIHMSKKSSDLDFKESMKTLSIAAGRYPHLAKLLKKKRDFIYFQNLVFDWIKPEERDAFEQEFRREAGFLKWMYMKLCHICLNNKIFFNSTKPLRNLIKKI